MLILCDKVQVVDQPVQQQRQPMQQAPARDPKAEAWAEENEWFGKDNAMTYTAFDLHRKLTEEEGMDPQSDEYYVEVDKRIRLEFPHKFGNFVLSKKMGKHFLKLPKMGESVVEATLTKWLKEVGDPIEVDDIIVEIATDKVDSDVPSEVSGVLIEKKFSENDVVQVGEIMAVIQTDGEDSIVVSPPKEVPKEMGQVMIPPKVEKEEQVQKTTIPEVPTFSLKESLPNSENIAESSVQAIISL